MGDGAEIEHRVAAGLHYLDAGGGEELRDHYVWLIRTMLSNLAPDDLSTSTLVSLVALLMPEHSRAIGGEPGRGRRKPRGTVIPLIPRSATTN